MNWTDQYLSPVIQIAKFSTTLRKMIKDFKIIIPFGLLPHSDVESPKEELPELKNLKESGLKTIEKIYDASLTWIDNLEKKAFYLLSYITALFTLIALFYTLFSDYPLRVLLLVPICTLLITFFISFRCLKVKSVKQVFIGDIYRFETTKIPIEKAEEIHLNYLRATIFNEVKAGETADMLKAARMFLMTSMFLLFIAVGLMMAHGTDPKMPNAEDIHLKAINTNLGRIDSSLIDISNGFNNAEIQKQRIDSLAMQLLQLKKEINKKPLKAQ